MTVQLERPARKRRGPRWLVLVAVLTVLAVGAVVGVRWWQQHSSYPAVAGDRLRSFPAVDRTGLDAAQLSVLDVTEREFGRQPGGTTYSEGVREPWCADFVSWVMRASGQPLSNPNSGSWRIPGVYTLEEYYRGQHRFEQANNGYLPRAGDVVMYSDSSVFHQHTNIVISADSDTITTVGGNEAGESGGVAIHEFRPSGTSGLVGFGRLGTR